ncbi:cytochrome c biogenesis protein [Paludisphaera borealis]|uniref:Cytochrome c biogenesis protein CcsA n=1 Tax=Paludisphaera borealis TaxID=1387353 RepID=A0A1U7CKE8_9BACT|nr:cytochrome c biogenesis protein CcsA [Paludisphaera borealis]APW59414.1 Cytochrome c biogenesis protein CcsA [Paludisphaera borealis]
MRRYGRLLFGLGLCALLITTVAAVSPGQRDDQGVRKLGVGPAYEQLGKVAVMHQGRVKPLDTVAREEVKHVFSRETIKLLDDENRVVETWGPVAAFVDWIVRPEFWDSQPFILVDYLPLKRQILLSSIREQLGVVAAKSTTSADDKGRLTRLIEDSEITTGMLAELLKSSKLAADDQKTLTVLADKLHEEHKWLTPDELENAKIKHGDHDEPFMEWVSQLDAQKRKFDADPKSAQRLTEIEKRAIDVGQRLVTYKSYSGDEMRSAGLIRIMPRPSSRAALDYYKEVIPKARSVQDPRELSRVLTPIEFDALKALDTYWNDTPLDDRHTPGEDAKFDEKFSVWLSESSVWVPLKVLLKAEPEGLVKAGYPDADVRAFLTAYRQLENAETSAPGQVAADAAANLLKTSRALGEAVNPGKYPTLASMDRESHFNAVNPFWQAPFAYGAALALLAVSLGFAGGRRSEMGIAGKSFYTLGMLGLAAGIGLEVYGFYLRIAISGWAPVTNMYETVIWVALVTAVLSFTFELVYRRTFTALAGAGVALLGTITAANVPLLDPSIKSLQPVLRSNLWLTIHVLTEVSSYAAFGLAWGLGLIATFYYLTATYRRTPTFKELAAPLLPGLPLLATGGAGVAASYGLFGESWTTGDPLFYVFAIMGGIGWMVSLGTVLACAGEVVNRLTTRGLDDQPAVEVERHAAAGSRPRPSVEEIKAMAEAAPPLQLDARSRSMQQTAAMIKPLSNFIYRAMQVGVLLIAAGTILGGVWADYSWGRFWGWDPKEVWALITLLVYLVPLHGRFAGWVNTFGLVFASVACFLSVVMAWYGVNFILGVGLHSYGFVEGGSQGFMSLIIASMMSLPLAAYWRRWLGYNSLAA